MEYFYYLIDILFYIIFIAVIIILKIHFTTHYCNSRRSMLGKTAIVTGGNKGIGFEISLGLAARGCKVIIACRSKAEKEKNEIIKLSGNPNIHTIFLDLTSYAKVRTFCEEIKSKETTIDALVLNAGISKSTNVKTTDNLDFLMQANSFSHILMTYLLLDLIKKSERGRIVYLSSGLSFVNNLSVETLNSNLVNPTQFHHLRNYANSKMVNLIAARYFAEKLKHTNITVNAIHPGAIKTGIYDELLKSGILDAFGNFLVNSVIFACKPPVHGAQPVLESILAEKYDKTTGDFIWNWGRCIVPTSAKNKEFCQSIWKEIEKLIQITEEEKKVVDRI